MSRGDNRNASGPIDRQTRFADEIDAALNPRQLPAFVSVASKHSAMHGLGLMMIGASFLIVASTASVIAWTYFDATRQKPAPQIGSVSPSDIQALQRSVAHLAERNRLLQAELDGLSGPGGVLPRVIEQLQFSKQTDAAQTNAIQRLMQDRSSAFGETQNTTGVIPTPSKQTGGPIQVTPVGTGAVEQPQLVIVTPDGRAQGQGQ